MTPTENFKQLIDLKNYYGFSDNINYLIHNGIVKTVNTTLNKTILVFVIKSLLKRMYDERDTSRMFSRIY